MVFDLDCLGRKDFIRYIKRSETIVLKDFDNERMRYLLELIAEHFGDISDDGDIKYRKVKERIIQFAKENYNNVNISKRQIQKMLCPKKDICSKFAPVIAMVIYEFIVQRLPENLIKLREKYPQDKRYEDFVFDDILRIIGPANDPLVIEFNTYLTQIRAKLQNTFYVELDNLCNNPSEGVNKDEENN